MDNRGRNTPRLSIVFLKASPFLYKGFYFQTIAIVKIQVQI